MSHPQTAAAKSPSLQEGHRKGRRVPQAQAAPAASRPGPTTPGIDPAHAEALAAVSLSALRDLLQAVATGLTVRTAVTWKSLVNRIVRAGGKTLPDLAFDTLTDHLFDLLVENGLIEASGMAAVLAVRNARTLEELAKGPRGSLAVVRIREHLEAEALFRLHATYGLA